MITSSIFFFCIVLNFFSCLFPNTRKEGRKWGREGGKIDKIWVWAAGLYFFKKKFVLLIITSQQPECCYCWLKAWAGSDRIQCTDQLLEGRDTTLLVTAAAFLAQHREWIQCTERHECLLMPPPPVSGLLRATTRDYSSLEAMQMYATLCLIGNWGTEPGLWPLSYARPCPIPGSP